MARVHQPRGLRDLPGPRRCGLRTRDPGGAALGHADLPGAPGQLADGRAHGGREPRQPPGRRGVDRRGHGGTALRHAPTGWGRCGAAVRGCIPDPLDLLRPVHAPAAGSRARPHARVPGGLSARRSAARNPVRTDRWPGHRVLRGRLPDARDLLRLIREHPPSPPPRDRDEARRADPDAPPPVERRGCRARDRRPLAAEVHQTQDRADVPGPVDALRTRGVPGVRRKGPSPSALPRRRIRTGRADPRRRARRRARLDRVAVPAGGGRGPGRPGRRGRDRGPAPGERGRMGGVPDPHAPGAGPAGGDGRRLSRGRPCPRPCGLRHGAPRLRAGESNDPGGDAGGSGATGSNLLRQCARSPRRAADDVPAPQPPAGVRPHLAGGRTRTRSGVRRAVPHHAEPRGGCSSRRPPRRAGCLRDPRPCPRDRRCARSLTGAEPGTPHPHHAGDARVPVPDGARMGGRDDRQRLAQPGGALARVRLRDARPRRGSHRTSRRAAITDGGVGDRGGHRAVGMGGLLRACAL